MRGEGAGEGDADVRVGTGTAHEDEILAELVYSGLLAVAILWGFGSVEEKLESFALALAGIEILELIREDGRVYVGG